MRMNIIRFVAVIFAPFLFGCGTHNTDEALRNRFFKKEASFNKLVQMAHDDPDITRIAPDFIWPEDKRASFSTRRWDEYRALFRELDVEHGVATLDRNGGLILIVSATGIVGRGTAKGYAYSTKQLIPIVDSVDMAMPQPCVGKKDCMVFKPLKGDWYLYYEID